VQSQNFSGILRIPSKVIWGQRRPLCRPDGICARTDICQVLWTLVPSSQDNSKRKPERSGGRGVGELDSQRRPGVQALPSSLQICRNSEDGLRGKNICRFRRPWNGNLRAHPFEDFCAGSMQPYDGLVAGAICSPTPAVRTVGAVVALYAMPVRRVRPGRRSGKRISRFVHTHPARSNGSSGYSLRHCGEEEKEQEASLSTSRAVPNVPCETSAKLQGTYMRTIRRLQRRKRNPVGSDLTAVPLSLGSEEHGYTEFQGNLWDT